MINYFDIFVVIVTLGLAILGLIEGLVRGTIKLAGFIALLILIFMFFNRIIAMANRITILPQNIMIPLVFFVILIAGICVIHLIANVLHKLVHLTPIGFIDHGLGCALGILKALFLNGILALVISLTPPGSFLKNQYDTSVSADHLVTFISQTFPLIKKAVVPYYRRFSPQLPEPLEKQENGTIPENFI